MTTPSVALPIGSNNWIQPSCSAGLPAHLGTVQSSYAVNGYDRILYAFTLLAKPKTILEFGVLGGFSLISMAAALADSREGGSIVGYDLFEMYPYKSCSFDKVKENISLSGMDGYARIGKIDAWDLEHCPIDMLHVDLSNDGDTYRAIFEKWGPYVSKAILLEGGSSERDRESWMLRFNRPPIQPAIEEIRQKYPSWAISVCKPWPSLTIAVRR
jgi:hypothetical protein